MLTEMPVSSLTRPHSSPQTCRDVDVIKDAPLIHYYDIAYSLKQTQFCNNFARDQSACAQYPFNSIAETGQAWEQSQTCRTKVGNRQNVFLSRNVPQIIWSFLQIDANFGTERPL